MERRRLRQAITVRKVDNLNKNSFWDAAKELCPATSAVFYDWMDRYKKGQFFCPEWGGVVDNWAVIGLEAFDGVFTMGFHDIPIEMQIGIINRFFTEVYGDVDFTPLMMCGHNWVSTEGWLDVVCNMFEIVEHVINPRPDRLWDVPPMGATMTKMVDGLTGLPRRHNWNEYTAYVDGVMAADGEPMGYTEWDNLQKI